MGKDKKIKLTSTSLPVWTRASLYYSNRFRQVCVPLHASHDHHSAFQHSDSNSQSTSVSPGDENDSFHFLDGPSAGGPPNEEVLVRPNPLFVHVGPDPYMIRRDDLFFEDFDIGGDVDHGLDDYFGDLSQPQQQHEQVEDDADEDDDDDDEYDEVAYDDLVYVREDEIPGGELLENMAGSVEHDESVDKKDD